MKYPITVLHMTKLGPGGISTLTVNINSLLNLERIHFDYLVFENEETFYEDKVFAFGAVKRVVDVKKYQSHKLVLYWKKYSLTRKMLREHPYDFMHVDASTPLDVVIGFAAKHAGVKRIILHSHIAGDNKESVARSIYMTLCKRLMNYVITDYFAISDAAAAFMFPKSVVNSHKYRIVKNGIIAEKYNFEPQMRKRIREDLQISDCFVIGHVGRFSDEKNHMFLLEVFKRCLVERPNAVLLLIGDGILRPALEKAIDDFDLTGKVLLYGTTPNVNEMLMAMDVFVFPSRYEGLGIAAIEAQCSGLPTFCSDGIPDEADITDLFNRIHGYDPDEWAKAIIEPHLSERKDHIREIRESGYDLSNVARELEQFYETH